MIKIRYMKFSDRQFWNKLDKHLPATEYDNKVQTKRGYILLSDDEPVGLLRFNLFWDNIPFCTLLYIDEKYQDRGYGKQLLEYWENDMKLQGHCMILTSTQVDETAQHFYRKAGNRDCGGLILDHPALAQPMEIFLMKEI